MTYLGTRPPLISETSLYELHHRARLAIKPGITGIDKPGITGMWQVSGRSDITDFEEIVRLDTEYISEWNIGLDMICYRRYLYRMSEGIDRILSDKVTRTVMTNEIIETVKSCLTLLIAILCLIFSKSRFKENKRYAVKYENSSILLILRLILTYLLKIISIIILIGICTNKLDVFIAFYVFTPMLICLQLIFFYTNDTKAMFTLVKGFYYLGLSIISLIQFLCENQNVAELALGFTLALAIFESIAAISEGIMKLQKK